MFQKHINFSPTGDYRERTTDGINWCIWEVENGRMVDPDNYVPYLEYTEVLPVIDKTPVLIVEPIVESPTDKEVLMALVEIVGLDLEKL